MARVRMVTRTIENVTFECKVLVDADDAIKTVNIGVGCIEGMSEKQVDKLLRNSVPDGCTFIKQTAKYVETAVYGMTEKEFLQYARIVER